MTNNISNFDINEMKQFLSEPFRATAELGAGDSEYAFDCTLS